VYLWANLENHINFGLNSFQFSKWLPLRCDGSIGFFLHFNHFSSSDPFLLIKNFDRILNIREVRFYQYFLLFNNFGRNSNTLLELRDMKDIMDGCKWRE
jgi:hypothetical protein